MDTPGVRYPGDIRTLTSLRFLAAFGVVLYHYEWPTKHLLYFQNLNLGVDFFFILSGFILTHADFNLKAGQGGYRSFLVKRLARIYPLHLATLLFFVGLVVVFHALGKAPDNPERFDMRWLPAHLLLVNAWTPIDHGTFNYPAWSVSAEWFAYLLFPAFLAAVYWKKLSESVMLGTSAIVLAGFYLLVPLVLHSTFTALHSNFGIVRIFPEFLLGVALYRFGSSRILRPLGHPGFFWAWLLATMGMVAFGIFPLVTIFCFAVLILSAAETVRIGRPQLAGTVPVYLGEVSYAIYMVHIPLATLLFKACVAVFGAVTLPMAIVGSVLVIPVAMIARHVIEVPGRSLTLKWLSRPAK